MALEFSPGKTKAKDTISEILYGSSYENLDKTVQDGMGSIVQLANAIETPELEDLRKINMMVGFDDHASVIRPKAIQKDPNEMYSKENPLIVDKVHGVPKVMLKQLSVRDPVVSAIIKEFSIRIAAFGIKSRNRYDVGSKVIPIDGLVSGGNKDKVDAVVKNIENWFFNVGNLRKRPPKYRMTFEEFLNIVTRDMLTYGYAAVEKVRDKDGSLAYLWPADTSTIYYARPGVSKADLIGQLSNYVDDKGTYKLELHNHYKYIQVIQGKAYKGFTDDEMDFIFLTRQSWWENQGITTGPLELCLPLINSHLQSINYNNNFLLQGTAAKMILMLKNASPQTVQEFRARWNSMISQAHINGFRTPIVGGEFEIEQVSLGNGPKDMEMVQFQDDLVRKMCAIFGIDPAALGWSHLARTANQSSLSEGSQAWKVAYSEKRGFKPVLNILQNWINSSVLPEIQEGIEEILEFLFVGLDREDKQVELQRFQQELSTYRTINDIREEVGLEPLPDLGSNMVLNPTALQINQVYMKANEIRATYMGKDAATPEFDAPPANQAFMQIQQMEMQAEQQAQMIQQQADDKAEKMEKNLPVYRSQAENIRDDLMSIKSSIEEEFEKASKLALAKLTIESNELTKHEGDCGPECDHE